ncbi:hypothetical protein [Defluviimonas sp. SAOS-178_SWC]|uniref:hypothetical protein n=1 Tax=Defluviimonas sp. SAOS-178_SWC TaxID=3121287 RepID=UPI0032220DA4
MKFDTTTTGAAFARGVSVLALGAVALVFWPGAQPGSFGDGPAAWAQTHTGGSGGSGGHEEDHDDHNADDGHSGGKGGKGGSGGHDGEDGEHEDDGGHSGGKGGQGGHKGGNPNPGSGQGAGQGQGQGRAGSAGGKPVWAQEGIPEVELGRLNVARSPDQVLQRAYDEALASLSPEMADFYSMNLNEMILELSTNFDNLSYIDSPLQNLALFQDALDGASVLTSTGEITNSTDTLMAAFLGVASDKNLPISADTVTAVSTILGAPVTGSAAAALAADAEAVRIAVLAGHG